MMNEKRMDTVNITNKADELAGMIRLLYTQKSEAERELEELTRKSTDIQHELEKVSYETRCRMATELANVLRERRKVKDWLKDNEPFFNYFGEGEGNKAKNMIGNIVGIGRRIETRKSKRKINA